MRLEMTKKTDLVLRVVNVLAQNGGRHTGAELAEAVGTSHQLVPKLMEPLVKQRWAKSTPGPSGGYELSMDTSTVSILELVEAVEGPTESGRCVLKGTPCPATEQCAIHAAWAPARDALMERLASTTIDDVRRAGGV